MNINTEQNLKKIDSLCRHINNVIQFANVLGRRLIEKNGQFEYLGQRLIANSYIHDHSKFNGIEWLYLVNEQKKNINEKNFADAIYQHINTNKHHPEYWGGIENMPTIYLLELICDWAARSSEIGNDLREWIKSKATKKYNMTVQSRVYKEIKDFVDILLEQEL